MNHKGKNVFCMDCSLRTISVIVPLLGGQNPLTLRTIWVSLSVVLHGGQKVSLQFTRFPFSTPPVMGSMVTISFFLLDICSSHW